MNGMDYSIHQAIYLLLGLDSEIWEIVFLSLGVSLSSTLLASCLAIPLAIAITLNQFAGKRAVIAAVQSFIAVPTVVIELICYPKLLRSGC